MKEKLDDYSIREKNQWFALLVDVVVALYYWPQALRLLLAGDEALRGGAMVGLITGTVMWAIFVSAGLSVFLHTQQKPEPMDERDYLINARSSVLAGRVLASSVLVILGMAVVQELGGAQVAPLTLFTLTPLVIAHLLLVALMLWSLTNSSARLYFYRRGY